ncbi:MAG TPA: F0F1 ATP synthase subunit epsilon [Xanthobacteraceae bacterium]|jgi:F-type H+-transporting ATPase subunit epsilon
MAGFPFELVSPAQLVFSGEVEQVDVPGAEGDFGVLAGHAPFVSTLRPGVLTIRGGGNARRYFVREGFSEVNAKGLTVLAETAVPVEEIDREALAAAIKEAEQAVSEAKDDEGRWKAIEVADRLKVAAAQIGQAASTAH